jgi:hypothetical protein
MAQLYPRALGSLFRLAGLQWKYSNPPPHGVRLGGQSESESESESRYDWRPVSQYVLVSSPIWEFDQRYFFFLRLLFCLIWGAVLVELEFFLLSTVSRPVSLGIGPPIGTLDQILACSSSFFDNYVMLLSMRPLWRENGSVVYSSGKHYWECIRFACGSTSTIGSTWCSYNSKLLTICCL